MNGICSTARRARQSQRREVADTAPPPLILARLTPSAHLDDWVHTSVTLYGSVFR